MPLAISPLTASVPSSQPFVSAGARPESAVGLAQATTNQKSKTASVPSKTSLDVEALQKIVSQMQSKLAGTNSDLEFSVDKDSGQFVVKVTERSTKNVIWQFPSDQALQVSKELSRFLGAFVNRAV